TFIITGTMWRLKNSSTNRTLEHKWLWTWGSCLECSLPAEACNDGESYAACSNTPGSGRHMTTNAMLNVQPRLHYVGTCVGEALVGPRNGGSGTRS
ncbi:hypothetical protein HAX54_028982, partial [Datura stramonium]|nr:hypothetical protein [Datura stramonium]